MGGTLVDYGLNFWQWGGEGGAGVCEVHRKTFLHTLHHRGLPDSYCWDTQLIKAVNQDV